MVGDQVYALLQQHTLEQEYDALHVHHGEQRSHSFILIYNVKGTEQMGYWRLVWKIMFLPA